MEANKYERERDTMNREKGEAMLQINVRRIADGTGFGEGHISHKNRLDTVSSDTIQNVESIIESPEILVKVDVDKQGNRLDDDGCGDGRSVRRIFEGTKEKFKSLNRSKVFAGGAGMAAATLIGMGEATGKTLNETFKDSITNLQQKMIGFGAHTDDHANDRNSGCGAFDKAPTVIENAGKYRDNIRSVMTEVLGIDETGIDDAFKNFALYANQIKAEDYKGKDVVEEIIESGKIVKELTGEHLEMYIVLNNVEGYTVNQELVRNVSDEQIQTFAVDVWRLQELASQLYDAPAKQDAAFKSMIIYTLSVAATLTKGDLPVYLASPAMQQITA